MIHLTCTEDEIEALRYEHFHHPHPRLQMKMAAVQLTALGLSRSGGRMQRNHGPYLPQSVPRR